VTADAAIDGYWPGVSHPSSPVLNPTQFLVGRPGTDLARRSQGFKSPHLHPQHCRSERRQPRAGDARCHVAAAPRPQAHVTVQPGRLSETRRLGPRPHTLTTERGRRRLPTDGRSSRIHPASPGRPCGRSGHCSTTAHDEDQVEADPPLAQHGLRQPQAPRSTPSRRAVVDTPGDHAARPSQLHDCLPHCHAPRAFRSDTADAGRHGHRTATPDAGGRTLDTWTLRHRTGHRSVGQPLVGHWTLSPDTDADRATTAQPASEPLGPPRRATAYWNAQPCSCSRTTRQLLGRSVGQAAPRRTALLRRISGRA
jgi:hypothetical protein